MKISRHFVLASGLFCADMVLGLSVVQAGPAISSAPKPAAAASAPLSPAGQALARVQAAIGTPKCEVDADCATLALGQKACGGPEFYLPWSRRVSDEARLNTLAAQYLAATAAPSADSYGRLSNCMVQDDPGAVCKAKRCVLPTLGGPVPLLR